MRRIPMNLQYFSQEKTEKATPKKRQDAREKGQVAKSQEIPAALILLFVFLFYFLFGSFYGETLKDLFRIPLTQYMTMDITANNVESMAANLSTKLALMVAPVFAIAMIIGVFGNYIQFGFLFTTKPLEPKLDKIDPIQGFKRIFSLRALVEFFKSLLKMTLIGGISFWVLWGEIDSIISLSTVSVEATLKFIGNLTLKLGLMIAFILLVIACLDYLYQRYDHEKNLKMSKQDIKDEFKKTEGDPLIKGKIKERQRQMAMRRMMSEIPKADVVITNPTHFAVALKYEPSSMSAPTVIAKGTDYVALKIKEAAKEHGIVMVENRPLARALYAQVEMGQGVPEDLFQAVAEVLAYVYRLKGKVT